MKIENIEKKLEELESICERINTFINKILDDVVRNQEIKKEEKKDVIL